MRPVRASSRDTIAVVGHVTSRPALLLPILAVSWFWLFGATVVSGLPAFAKDVLFANEQVVTMMLALFAVGVGVGSIVAERLLHGEVSARYVPVAAAAMAFFAWDLHVGQRRPAVGRGTGERAGVPARRTGSWRILVDLVGVAMAGGLFTVPLYAILQHESEPAHRARVIAANNIINAVAMALAAVGAASPARARVDDGRALRAVRPADGPGRARGGVDSAPDDGEERPALDPQDPLPRPGGGARARACGDAEGGDRRQSRLVSRWLAARAPSCLAIRSSPSTP